MHDCYYYNSPIGELCLTFTRTHVTGLSFHDEGISTENASCPDHKEGADAPEILQQTIEWLDQYFAGAMPLATPPLCSGTKGFCKVIEEILLDIPYGETRTYGEVAKIAANKLHKEHMSAQAVGQALKKNPIAIIIPCHRVIGKSGKLTGYSGDREGISLWRKQYLLELEKKNR